MTQQPKSKQRGESIKYIASQFDVSTSAISIGLKRTLNKIFEKLVEETDVGPFEICKAMINYFDIEPKELINKLDQKHMTMVKYDARKEFGIQNEDDPELMRFFV